MKPKRGDQVQITSGRFAGRQGKVINVFRGVVTLVEASTVAIAVKEDEVQILDEEVIQA